MMTDDTTLALAARRKIRAATKRAAKREAARISMAALRRQKKERGDKRMVATVGYLTRETIAGLATKFEMTQAGIITRMVTYYRVEAGGMFLLPPDLGGPWGTRVELDVTVPYDTYCILRDQRDPMDSGFRLTAGAVMDILVVRAMLPTKDEQESESGEEVWVGTHLVTGAATAVLSTAQHWIHRQNRRRLQALFKGGVVPDDVPDHEPVIPDVATLTARHRARTEDRQLNDLRDEATIYRGCRPRCMSAAC